ncbi:MAG: triple tyrosine motif-containing protein [Candidatus Azotimanducaceae bacterium WSBS_2022_MAG_OTU7]
MPSAGLIFRRDASDTLLRFDHTNGVQVRDLNLNADVNLKPNILLLGGNEGINLISTESVQINTRTPPVQMTNLFLITKKLLDAEELQLNRNITYTNLDPGPYFLRVQGPNNDGIWNEDGLNIL